ncbi:MAG: HNH endonuclease [Planctomycetes bacterium]|nr:HNH endonuclease [Planctomycetota bacterium]MBI3833531.1 HNH endonuclease [Planctomycetota bacterium]
MPAVSPRQLVEAILEGIQDSGFSGAIVSSLREHPRKFVVTTVEGTSQSLWVYAWTLTHGGRPSLPYEYRIQMTTVESPLAENPVGHTVLIGYEPSMRVFGGFDLTRHRTFSVGSPSVQVDVRILRQALQDGLAFDRKSNQEIALGFRSDYFTNYAFNASTLHKLGRQSQTLDLLAKASSRQPIVAADIESLSQDRKRIVQTVSRLSRLSGFRELVRNAYGERCAVTRLQLRLIEAAHILPVGAPGSVDDVRNGIALSPTYHRAYDNGLIYLDSSYDMRINPGKESALQSLNLAGGLVDFKASLGRIHLPQDKRQWPDTGFIDKANRVRGIAV